VAGCSLFVLKLKVPLNTKQANKRFHPVVERRLASEKHLTPAVPEVP